MQNAHFENTKLSFLAALLRPLVWICLRKSFTIQECIEALKIAFVAEGSREIRKQGEKVNVSRLSLLTGIRRREVTRLYKQGALKNESRGLVTKVIGLWVSDKRFTSSTGKPRSLDETFDFPKLVRCVSKDVHPSTVSFELERLGLAVKTNFGMKLLKSGYVPRGSSAESYRLLAEDCYDLVRAAYENIESGSAPRTNPHVKTFYDNIDEREIPAIRKWLIKENKRLHRRLRGFLAPKDLDINPQPGARGGVRVAFGTYGLIDEDNDTGDSDE